jgi:hypothetical protein
LTRCANFLIGTALASGASTSRPAFATSQELPSLPLHLALVNTLEICRRQDAAERDRLKAHAALLIARHVVSKARRRSLSATGTVTAQFAPVGPPVRRRK